MSNLSFSTETLVGEAAKRAPFALMLMAIGSFLIVGILWTDYYTHIFSVRFEPWAAVALGVFAALIKEGVRLSLLISSIRDFSDNRKGNGWLGLLGSIALVWYEIATTKEVAALWAGDAGTADTYRGFIIFMVLLGLVLEFRLVLTMPRITKEDPRGVTKGNFTRSRANGVHPAGANS
jgi:uncharacterized membrane protein